MRFIKRHAILVSVIAALVILIGGVSLFFFVPTLKPYLFTGLMYSIFAALLLPSIGAIYNGIRVLRRRKRKSLTWIPSFLFAAACLTGFCILLGQYIAL